MPNIFLDLQTRCAELLAPAFTGDTILTEALGDLTQQIERVVLELGFGLVVTTARGQAINDEQAPRRVAAPLTLAEELTVAVIHNPLLAPGRTALDAVSLAIAMLHGKPLSLIPGGGGSSVLRVLGHEARDDAPGGLVVHHIRIGCTVHFTATYLFD